MGTPTVADIREIQSQTSGRSPRVVGQGAASGTLIPAADISAANGAPVGASAGVSVLGSSGRSAVLALLLLELDATITSADVQWWGYVVDPVSGYAAWCKLRAQLWAGVDANNADVVPVGTLARVYCEVLALTGTGAVRALVAPAEGTP